MASTEELLYLLLLMVFPFHAGLPLSEDIEGPPDTTNVDFVIGARPINTGSDSNYAGLLTGLVIIPQTAPPEFSQCVLQCLESMTADTTGTEITASTFDRSQRQLVLMGPASPETFETVLRSITYTSLALDINLASIEVDIHDGINNTVESVEVVQGNMRRKREVTDEHISSPQQQHFHQHRHVLAIGKEEEKENKNDMKQSDSGFVSFNWALVVIVLTCAGILIAILAAWKMMPKQATETSA